jgi:hypothetical protein
MGFYRRIEDFFQRPPANTVHFSDAEKALRQKQRQDDNGAFAYTDEGFTYQVEDRLETVLWRDLERIIAYKLDRITYDIICLRLYWPGSDLLISEDELGWYQFSNRLNTALPAIKKGWEEQVALPPFETTETLVYQK